MFQGEGVPKCRRWQAGCAMAEDLFEIMVTRATGKHKGTSGAGKHKR